MCILKQADINIIYTYLDNVYDNKLLICKLTTFYLLSQFFSNVISSFYLNLNESS